MFHRFFSTLALLPLIFASAAPAQDLSDVNILVFDYSLGYDHTFGRPAFLEKLDSMRMEMGFSVNIVTNGDKMVYDTLIRYDLVIFNNIISGQNHTEQQKDDFRQYVLDGGAWYGMHGSCIIEDSTRYAWYVEEFIGARWKDHPMGIADRPVAFTADFLAVEGAKAALVPDVPETGLSWADEWYNFHWLNRDSILIWMTVDPEGNANQFTYGSETPMMWNKRVGKGHYWYTSMGHDRVIWGHEHVYDMFRAGLLHAVGYIGCSSMNDAFSIGVPLNKPQYPVVEVCADGTLLPAHLPGLFSQPYILSAEKRNLSVAGLNPFDIELFGPSGRSIARQAQVRSFRRTLTPGAYTARVTAGSRVDVKKFVIKD